jgi:transcriptional regulator with XRE-family HTH domain
MASISRRLRLKSPQTLIRWEKGSRQISWRDFVRLCEATDAPIAQSLVALSFRSDFANAPLLVDRIVGGAKITEVAKSTGISRYTLTRWLHGEGCPDLADVLQLIHHCQYLLFEFIAGLVEPVDIPSLAKLYDQRQARKSVYFEHPVAAAIVATLGLDSYRALPAHDDAFVSRSVGIPEKDAHDIICKLLETGRIGWRDGRLEPRAGQLELSDHPDFRKFCGYWLERAKNCAEREKNPLPFLNYGMDIYPTSAATLRQLHEEYTAFYKRARAILAHDAGPRDQVFVFTSIFFDASEASADKLLPRKPRLWQRQQKSSDSDSISLR